MIVLRNISGIDHPKWREVPTRPLRAWKDGEDSIIHGKGMMKRRKQPEREGRW